MKKGMMLVWILIILTACFAAAVIYIQSIPLVR